MRQGPAHELQHLMRQSEPLKAQFGHTDRPFAVFGHAVIGRIVPQFVGAIGGVVCADGHQRWSSPLWAARSVGFWSLMRSWLRSHQGIAQEKLPLYLGFFESVHNVRKRGKALLGALIEWLVC
jgi:hypothetical protein